MKVTQEPEGLHPRRVLQGGLVLGVLSVISVAVAWLVLVPSPGALERGSPRPDTTFGEPARIETHLFLRGPALSSQSAARARLQRYGWVDRSAGVIHVPIQRAMDLYLHHAAPGVTPEPPDPGAGP